MLHGGGEVRGSRRELRATCSRINDLARALIPIEANGRDTSPFSSKSLESRPREMRGGRGAGAVTRRVTLLRGKNRNDVRRRLMQAAFRDISGAPTFSAAPLIASIDRGDATSVLRKTHSPIRRSGENDVASAL